MSQCEQKYLRYLVNLVVFVLLVNFVWFVAMRDGLKGELSFRCVYFIDLQEGTQYLFD